MHARTSSLAALAFASAASAQTAVNPAHANAWFENLGWTDWSLAGDGQQSARRHPSFLSGFVWSENAGYLNLGDGTPAGGASYANVNGSDCGVNVAANGRLSGLAWGENIGWVNFGPFGTLGATQQARIELATSRLHGYAWGENVGWLNLDDATRFVAFTGACGPADIAHAFGTLDINDILTFASAYNMQDPLADFYPTPGGVIFDINDVLVFAQAFNAGCP